MASINLKDLTLPHGEEAACAEERKFAYSVVRTM